MDNKGKVIRASRERYRASQSEGFPSTLIFEKTREGVLVTELDEGLGVLDQEYFKNGTVVEIIGKKLGAGVRIKPVELLERTSLTLNCDVCSKPLFRELDFVDPCLIDRVPVVPIFRCAACDKRFYSITKAYLGRLVDRNNALLDEKERAALEDNRESLINIMNEYVIRIFASKKISRIKTKE